jgi:hypothetical protein
MSAQLLNLDNPKDLEEFFNALKEFGFRAINDHTYRLVLIEGMIEYFGYYGNDEFKVIVQHENAELTVTRDRGRYLITLRSPKKVKQYEIPNYTVIEYRVPHLAIEY